MVVIPCLLTTPPEIADLLEALEIRYLGNRDANLFFALLTDFQDAPERTQPDDDSLLEQARAGMQALSEKYREDRPGIFTLHPVGPDTDAIFFFRDVQVLTEGCKPGFDETVGNTAAEIAAWMAANPGVIATNVQPVTQGGLRGVVLDIAASGTYTTVCPNDQDTYPGGLPILPLFGGAGSGDLTWFVGGDERMRLYLLDMPGGGNVVISIDAIGGDFETLLETTQLVLYGITFDPDYY